MRRLTLSDLEDMDRTALLAAWSTLLDGPVPKNLSQPLMRSFLAFEIQARRMGGLPKGFAKDLSRQVQSAPGQRGARATLPAGGKLLREWNGVTHEVIVTEAGYEWRGQSYRSLSAIARAITGARWSGPRFFGLKEQRP